MEQAALLQRPIFGGVFDAGRYALATVPCVVRGLHAVRFMVVEVRTGAVLSLADDKTTALTAARGAIKTNARLEAQTSLEADRDTRQAELWPGDGPSMRPIVERRRPVSKRRRDIFAKSAGRCHYCDGVLHLDGVWHVEHMLPRALGGGDDASNLVAACSGCNLRKRDLTALEFLARGGR